MKNKFEDIVKDFENGQLDFSQIEETKLKEIENQINISEQIRKEIDKDVKFLQSKMENANNDLGKIAEKAIKKFGSFLNFP